MFIPIFSNDAGKIALLFYVGVALVLIISTRPRMGYSSKQEPLTDDHNVKL